MDADVKAEFDEIKKLLGDVARRLAGGGAAAPTEPIGAPGAVPFGRIKRDLDALGDDDVVPAPGHCKVGFDKRSR